MDSLIDIFNSIKIILSDLQPPLIVTADYESRYEMYTNKPAEINGRKKTTLSFASLIIQSGYVGFYFMPIYTHPHLVESLKPELRRLLKGKSCFHVKKIDTELMQQIQRLIGTGYKEYQENGWI